MYIQSEMQDLLLQAILHSSSLQTSRENSNWIQTDSTLINEKSTFLRYFLRAEIKGIQQVVTLNGQILPSISQNGTPSELDPKVIRESFKINSSFTTTPKIPQKPSIGSPSRYSPARKFFESNKNSVSAHLEATRRKSTLFKVVPLSPAHMPAQSSSSFLDDSKSKESLKLFIEREIARQIQQQERGHNETVKRRKIVMQHAFVRKDRLPKLQNKYISLPNRRGLLSLQFKNNIPREPKISSSSSIARIRGTAQEEDKLRSYNSTPLLSIQQSPTFPRSLSNSNLHRAQSIQRLALERPSSRKAEQLSKSIDYNKPRRQDSQSIFEDSEWSSVKDSQRFDDKLTPGFLEKCDSFSFGGSDQGEVRERFGADLNLVSLKIPNPYGGRFKEVEEWKKK